MRNRGGGVSHRSICEATQCLLNDHDKLDTQLFTLECCESSTEDGEDGGDSDIPMDDSSDPEEGGTSDEDGSEIDGVNLGHTQQLVGNCYGRGPPYPIFPFLSCGLYYAQPFLLQ